MGLLTPHRARVHRNGRDDRRAPALAWGFGWALRGIFGFVFLGGSLIDPEWADDMLRCMTAKLSAPVTPSRLRETTPSIDAS